jgi:hypothetical protein
VKADWRLEQMRPSICHPGNTLTTRPGHGQIRDWCYDQAYIATLELIRAEEIRIDKQRWRGIPPLCLAGEPHCAADRGKITCPSPIVSGAVLRPLMTGSLKESGCLVTRQEAERRVTPLAASDRREAMASATSDGLTQCDMSALA